MKFSWTAWVLKKTSTPSASEWKSKKAISESTVNSQRIGITLKFEAIKKEVKEEFDLCTLFHFISENEIIHILMYFIETRQVGLELTYVSATKKGRTSNKIRSKT